MDVPCPGLPAPLARGWVRVPSRSMLLWPWQSRSGDGKHAVTIGRSDPIPDRRRARDASPEGSTQAGNASQAERMPHGPSRLAHTRGYIGALAERGTRPGPDKMANTPQIAQVAQPGQKKETGVRGTARGPRHAASAHP